MNTEADTFTCGVCGHVYTGEELAEWGITPRAWV
jgi:rubredoxin